MIKTQEEHGWYVEDLCRISYYYLRRWLVQQFPEQRPRELLKRHTPLLYHALGYLPDTWETEPMCMIQERCMPL